MLVRASALTLFSLCLFAERPPAADAARKWREANEPKIIAEYATLLRIPNVASDKTNIRRNAEFIAAMYAKRGVKTQLLEVPDANPAVYGEVLVPGARRTLMFYAHYDGQPVDPSKWNDSGPFEPVLRTAPVEMSGKLLPLEQTKYDPEWRLFARSATDDKVPIIALATALDAMKAAGIRHRANIKFFFEGEEEAGSTNLRRILTAHKDKLKGDLWLICDGPVHQSRNAKLSFGARGVAGFELTVFGAKRALHSGHYGNWAPNPAMHLARLLASMTDGEGRVLVKGFYDDVVPPTKLEKDTIARIPAMDGELKKELLIGAPQQFNGRLAESIYQPALNIRGLESALVGAKAANVVRPVATASIDLRLVKGNDARRQADKLIAHVREQGYFVVEGRDPSPEERLSHPKAARVDVHISYNAFRTPLDLPVAQEVVRLARLVREPVIIEPSSGGSLPLVVFEEVTGAPIIAVPISNHDDNQHTHNENLRIGNLWDGIELLAALLAM